MVHIERRLPPVGLVRHQAAKQSGHVPRPIVDSKGPEVDQAEPKILSATVGTNNKSVVLKVDGLVKGHVHHLLSSGMRSKKGLPLLHPNAYYTLNEIPTK